MSNVSEQKANFTFKHFRNLTYLYDFSLVLEINSPSSKSIFWEHILDGL